MLPEYNNVPEQVNFPYFYNKCAYIGYQHYNLDDYNH